MGLPYRPEEGMIISHCILSYQIEYKYINVTADRDAYFLRATTRRKHASDLDATGHFSSLSSRIYNSYHYEGINQCDFDQPTPRTARLRQR